MGVRLKQMAVKEEADDGDYDDGENDQGETHDKGSKILRRAAASISQGGRGAKRPNPGLRGKTVKNAVAAVSGAAPPRSLHLTAMTEQRKRPAGPPPDIECGRTIVLVGIMGAGKTTIGRRLALRLGLPFFDADQEIERAAGMTVSELFRVHGEESFRRGEAQVISRLLAGPPIVLATGGGAVVTPETRRLIKKRALSVWLKADVDTVLKRATRRNTRPLLQNANPRATLSRLLEERTPFYAEADVAVESLSGPHSRTIDAIFEAIRPRLTKRPSRAKAVE